ncbi:uncharacterized protein N7459_007594, partial [Penicillium hispanicum]|uniref:uncharacterized protein n=1 Tax=Penicillium hispanicum TaxID=1080232 RepID=UPI00254061C6
GRCINTKAESETDRTASYGLASSSEPHLPCHCQMPELPAREARRHSTASDTLDCSESASRASESPQIGNSGDPAKCVTDSGLKWNCVVPALNLLRNAGYEAQQPQADGRLARSLYISAVMYLLDALPLDLNPEETMMLQHRMPEPVKTSLATCLGPSGTSLEATGRWKMIQPTRSYLHRLLASSIVQLFLLIRFILPYARLFLRQVYEYERSHRITERIVTTTLYAADELGKSSVNIGSAVCKFNEGRVGAAVGNLTSWWIEGIAGVYTRDWVRA